jgi:hypothetical protein
VARKLDSIYAVLSLGVTCGGVAKTEAVTAALGTAWKKKEGMLSFTE